MNIYLSRIEIITDKIFHHNQAGKECDCLIFVWRLIRNRNV